MNQVTKKTTNKIILPRENTTKTTLMIITKISNVDTKHTFCGVVEIYLINKQQQKTALVYIVWSSIKMSGIRFW